MKRLLIVCLLAVLLIPAMGVAAIDDITVGPASMAQYMPDDTGFFAAIRTDDGYLSDLDAVYQRVITALPTEARVDAPESLRGALEANMADSDVTYDEVRTWLGDYAAFGATNLDIISDSDPSNDDQATFYVMLEITDSAAYTAFFEAQMAEEAQQVGDLNGYPVYQSDDETFLTYTDNLLLISNKQEGLTASPETTLAGMPDFQTAMSGLPEPGYNIVMYVDTPQFLTAVMAQDPMSFQQMGVSPDDLGPTAMGFTILEGRSFTIDVAQSIANVPALGSVSQDFANRVPAGTAVLVHATDLTTVVNTFLDTVDELARQQDPEQDMRQQLTGLLTMMTGLDLQADILSWTTGDYALVMDIDSAALMALAQSADPNSLDPNQLVDALSLGLLIEATDPGIAAGTAGKIADALDRVLANQEGVTIAPGSVAGQDATTISIEVPLDATQSLTVKLALGVADNVFFFGTTNLIEDVLSGENGLGSDATYQDAAQFFLPDPINVVYTDDEGLLMGMAIPILTLLGPAIGNVFENIIDDLESPQAVLPTRMTIQEDDPMQQMMQALEAYTSLVSSSSITATYADGVSLVRMVITLEPQ